MVEVKSNGVRAYRKAFMAQVRAGVAELRAIGSAATGFKLAAVVERGRKVKAVVLFPARTFAKTTDANRFALERFGRPSRMMRLAVAS